MGEPEGPDALRDELRAAWHRYVDRVAPLRPALHAYCRRLTGDLWDAEDLVQDTLLRAFAHLGSIHHAIRDPRSYLLRTATHVWIDTLRRAATHGRALDALPPPAPAGPGPDAGPALRDASAQILGRLAPQERAAVVLREAFELPIDEIAAILVTTPGAVKAALHRGRERLVAPDASPVSRYRPPSPALVEGFIERWRAGDVPGLLGLLLESASTENVGCGLDLGPDSVEPEEHFLYKAVHGHPEWPAAFQPEAVRVERGQVAGEPVVLCFATRRGEEALEQLLRLEEVEGRIARLRGYAFCPETLRAVAETLGVPVRTGLYRYPTPAPGQAFRAAP